MKNPMNMNNIIARAEATAEALQEELAQVAIWYNQPEVTKAVRARAPVTKKFLIEHRLIVNKSGEVEFNGKSWWPQTFNPGITSFIARDLRATRMRQRALAYGIAHFLGELAGQNLLPGGCRNYIDDVTNLASLRAHERLMEEYLEEHKAPYYLEELKPLYLYSPETKGEQLRSRLITMQLLGLWHSQKPKRTHEIRIGPFARIFHEEAYAPAIQKLIEHEALRPPVT